MTSTLVSIAYYVILKRSLKLTGIILSSLPIGSKSLNLYELDNLALGLLLVLVANVRRLTRTMSTGLLVVVVDVAAFHVFNNLCCTAIADDNFFVDIVDILMVVFAYNLKQGSDLVRTLCISILRRLFALLL
jgi:hypothetical protein